ncbi:MULTISPECIES: amylo-alpha-1,6-glucosidase [Desulfovibrio]|uniref:Glycogen debranching enzyme, putative n=1 Tax=Desulfovibrio desulfuricans TaxID=876 RepID=A0AA94L1R6_DESDE|nr:MULTISPECIES: amylo-alpha-1,6-glucosidase [Desulfovibrio]ATD82029.1 glycogen debranching protein [Desulfovibrio sp. G11]SFW35199.1 glycogen debranching enzyme, putative [Desulfovibrio desulfuricans]SPD34779.1 Glycogen debranching enzyme [Desulfovibrio sp. G11]
MRFSFDKAACQNTRRALRKEWLLTNGLGDYAGSTILCCNTRKYHGLLTVNTPHGRHVLLSALEESIVGGGREFPLSTRQHPDTLYPHGHDYLEAFRLDHWPRCVYRVGDVHLCREILLVQGQSRLAIRWSIRGPAHVPALTLRLRPLLAYRSFHKLTHANAHLRSAATLLPDGFSISPYEGLPSLYIQCRADAEHTFTPQPDWCYNVEYLEERERGFAYSEDLFMPGTLDVPLPPLSGGNACVYLTAGTAVCDGDMRKLWEDAERTRDHSRKNGDGLSGHLARTGQQFCITSPEGRPEVLAGYHWFDAWGRDTLISLPGLTFHAGRTDFGLRVLADMGNHVIDGLIPNMFSPTGDHAYNSVDAALWYAFALQSCLESGAEHLVWLREHAWHALKAVISGYRAGAGKARRLDIRVDDEGLLHAGNAHSQLTWMDARVDGRPVTPRQGCPVEINALWYNTLAFADQLAARFGEAPLTGHEALRRMRTAFLQRFWVPHGGGYLGDVWRDGRLDTAVRPNQIFAVSLPHAILAEDCQAQVVECVRNKLLTPYGLRTLAPDDPHYKGRYDGGTAERDGAYHQGTVWPWLLGHYADALLRTAWDVDGAVMALLDTLTPLYCDHLAQAGLASISEVFDGSPPYKPNGCIAQAWSVAECLRLLLHLQKAAPAVYRRWHQLAAHRMSHPVIGDTAGICRISMATGGGREHAPARQKDTEPATTATDRKY